LQILEDSGKYWLYRVLQILYTSIADTGYTSFADTGLEDSGKYWLYQFCRYIVDIAVCDCKFNAINM
jgi:hypothetical protein